MLFSGRMGYLNVVVEEREEKFFSSLRAALAGL